MGKLKTVRYLCQRLDELCGERDMWAKEIEEAQGIYRDECQVIYKEIVIKIERIAEKLAELSEEKF
jgi:hypothetical protein